LLAFGDEGGTGGIAVETLHAELHGFGVAQPLLQRKHVVNRLADATDQIGQLHEATDIVLAGDLIQVMQSHGSPTDFLILRT
jgi:hypothetical protein